MKKREDILICRIQRLVDLKSSWARTTKSPDGFVSKYGITGRTFYRDKLLLQELGLFKRVNGRLEGKSPYGFNKMERLVDLFTCGLLESGDPSAYTKRYNKGVRTARRDVALLKKCFSKEISMFYKWKEDDGL